MKKLVLSLILLCFVIGAGAQSNIIKTNPVGFAFGNFNATYEKVLNSSSSVLFRGEYSYKLLGLNASMGGLGLGYRYYITHAKKEVPNGFYINPQLSLGFGSLTDNNGNKGTLSLFGVGADLGYQWVWSSGFVLDLGIGPTYAFLNGGENLSGLGGNGFIPNITIAIGYAF